MEFSDIKVGDRVVIERPTSNNRSAAIVVYAATVTAVRAASFDAGELRFHKDGRQYWGRSRAAFIFPAHRDADVNASVGNRKASGLQSSGWPGKDLFPAAMESSSLQ